MEFNREVKSALKGCCDGKEAAVEYHCEGCQCQCQTNKGKEIANVDVAVAAEDQTHTMLFKILLMDISEPDDLKLGEDEWDFKIDSESSLLLKHFMRAKSCVTLSLHSNLVRSRIENPFSEDHTHTQNLSLLPSEVEENILSRLPVKILKKCRCVCKHWCNLVTTPHFIKMQLNRSIQINRVPKVVIADGGKVYIVDIEAWRNQNFEDGGLKNIKIELVLPFSLSDDIWARAGGMMRLKVFGSCNGLLFLSTSNGFYLLNPATNEHKWLPRYYDILGTGFGYNPSTDEYKVMIIRYTPEEHVVYVYTLGKDSSWRSIGHTEYRFKYPYHHHALVNGVLHWMASDIPGFKILLVSFDLGDEKFRELSLPTSFSKEDTSKSMGLVELDGFLSLYHWKEVEKFDIWVMKVYGDNQSWTKVFSAAQPILSGFWGWFKPLYFLKKDEILWCENKSEFFVLDVVKNEIHTIKLKHRSYNSVTVMHMESLVSPRSIGEMNCGK